MSVAAMPKKTLLGRLAAKIKKPDAVKTNDSSNEAQPVLAELSSRPTVTPPQLRQMPAAKRFPNENVEETRRAHIEYLEDKKEQFTTLLERLKQEKNMLNADEAELAYGQSWAAEQKEALSRDFENIHKEEREAMLAQVKKKPQEVEAALNGGEPSLPTRFELLYEVRCKMLVSLQEVEDEEMDNVDEEEQLRTKREELTRRTKETEEKLASVEETLFRVCQAMKEQEAAQSVRKEQLPAPPAEPGGSTRKRTAQQTSEEGQQKKAKIPFGLEEEEPEDEEEESEDEEEESEDEEEEPEPDHAAQRSSGSTPSATRRHNHPDGPKEKLFLTFEVLTDRAKTSTLEIDPEGGYIFQCSVCKLPAKIKCGRQLLVGQHLSSHLAPGCLAYACPARNCKHATASARRIKAHFKSAHKLEWTAELRKESEVTENANRLDAIARDVLAANHVERDLSLDDLKTRAGNSTFSRDAKGILFMKCSVCTVKTKVVKSDNIRRHLVKHLRQSSLQLRCLEDGCKYWASRFTYLRDHFRISHEGKELTEQMEKDSKIIVNKKQLDAIVASIYKRRPRNKL